jgi:hypothetical protein
MSGALPQKRLIGYADRVSVRPGESLRFMVSCEEVSTYHAEIVRLVSGDLHPRGLGLIEHPVVTSITGSYVGCFQPIHAGSYAIIEAWDGLDRLEGFTIQAMIWPTRPGGRRQVILGRWATAGRQGFALILDEAGALALELGDGSSVVRVSTRSRLMGREWAFVAASFDAASGRVRLHQESHASVGRAPAPILREETVSLRPVAGIGPPLMIAACAETTDSHRPTASDHFNGKIDSPRIAAQVLERAEMEAIARFPEMCADRIHRRPSSSIGRAIPIRGPSSLPFPHLTPHSALLRPASKGSCPIPCIRRPAAAFPPAVPGPSPPARRLPRHRWRWTRAMRRAAVAFTRSPDMPRHCERKGR